jgi:hypothetical protein
MLKTPGTSMTEPLRLDRFCSFLEFSALVFGVFWRRTSHSLSENARWQGNHTHSGPPVSGRKSAVSGMKSSVSGNQQGNEGIKLAIFRHFR